MCVYVCVSVVICVCVCMRNVHVGGVIPCKDLSTAQLGPLYCSTLTCLDLLLNCDLYCSTLTSLYFSTLTFLCYSSLAASLLFNSGDLSLMLCSFTHFATPQRTDT